MQGFQRDDATPEEIEAEREVFGPFAQAVRELVDAGIRTLADPEDVRRARAEIEAVTARLREHQREGSYGVRIGPDGQGRSWGNAVVGLRNAVAPPLRTEKDGSGRVWADFHLGAAYEGPPTYVHGGVCSLVLDQLLGEAAGSGGKPGMTATLTLSYKQPTPLGDLRGEAWIESVEGYKTIARGHLIGPDGVTVEAEGLFVLPRWARERLARRDPDKPAPRYFE